VVGRLLERLRVERVIAYRAHSKAVRLALLEALLLVGQALAI
jgi:hypothetical protein